MFWAPPKFPDEVLGLRSAAGQFPHSQGSLLITHLSDPFTQPPAPPEELCVAYVSRLPETFRATNEGNYMWLFRYQCDSAHGKWASAL